jgi:hypothetical protein
MSGAYDPTYWPDTNYDRIGGDNDPVIGYAVQQDRMIVFKRRSIYLRSWELTTDEYSRTVMRYTSVPINTARGAYSADSIQLLENNPIFLSDEGAFGVYGTTIRDERNVEKMSNLINLVASGPVASIDYKGRYYLAIPGDKVWVCDYGRKVQDEATNKYVSVWYPWRNLPVNVWAEYGGDLYFGSNADGTLYRMKTKVDPLPYNDEGAPILAHFMSIFTTFDRDDQTKLVQSLIISMKPWSHSKLQIEYATEEGTSGVVHTEVMDLLSFGDINFNNFTFNSSRSERGFKVRIDDARNIQRFQVKLSSSGIVNEFFGFSSIDITYQTLSEVR